MKKANQQQAAVTQLTPNIRDYHLPPEQPKNRRQIAMMRSWYEIDRMSIEFEYTNVIYGPKWLRLVLGDHFFDDVVGVDMWIAAVPDRLPVILELLSIERLSLWSAPELRDLTPLTSLSRLKHLRLNDTIDDALFIGNANYDSFDLSPLHRLDRLREVHFGAFAEANNHEISQLKKALPNCTIFDDRLYKR